MVYECGDLLGETERFPDGPRRRSPTSTSTGSGRSGSAGHPRRQPRAPPDRTADRSARVAFSSTRRPATSGCAATVDRFPFVPTTPSGWRRTATRPTTSRSPGWCSGCAAIGRPEGVIGVSGGLDSTHALIVAAQGDGPARPAAQRHPRVHDAGLRHRRHAPKSLATAARQGARRRRSRRSTSSRRPSRCSRTSTTRPPSGEPAYDVTFENVQAGLRNDYLFRLANQRGGIVVGTGDLCELALGWCTYGVGDQMSHYNVNAGVPEDADPAPDPLGDRQRPVRRPRPTRCSARSSTEITPS